MSRSSLRNRLGASCLENGSYWARSVCLAHAQWETAIFRNLVQVFGEIARAMVFSTLLCSGLLVFSYLLNRGQQKYYVSRSRLYSPCIIMKTLINVVVYNLRMYHTVKPMTNTLVQRTHLLYMEKQLTSHYNTSTGYPRTHARAHSQSTTNWVVPLIC